MPDSAGAAEASDEYLATLLDREARDTHYGLASGSTNKPRPPQHGGRLNTRFLRNVIRDAEQHNASLLQSKPRLRESRHSPVRDRLRLSPYEDEDRSTSKRRKHASTTSSGVDKSHSRHRRLSRSDRSASPRHRRSRHQEDDEESRSRRHRRHRHREDSRRHRHDKPSRSPKPRHRSSRREHAECVSSRVSRSPTPRVQDDSDPLDEFIGPKLPTENKVTRRGRGTSSRGTGIDEHFSANYDPSADVRLDEDEEDEWGQALEALRDRQRWQQQRGDRLRAAGFSDGDITRAQRDSPTDVEHVRWNKHGEGREWDSGKVVEADGTTLTKPRW